jgi:xylulokinase
MYLGLDLGTSGIRAILVDASGHVHGTAESQVETKRPHPGWSEQDPSDWIVACENAIASLKKQVPNGLRDLRGIGLSGHMHGATLLDAENTVLRPCIMWNDTRCAEQAATLDRDPEMREISGNVVFPGFTAPKLVWLREQEPETFKRVAKVLLPKDYVRFWLSGELVGDMSDCAGTSWLDVGERAWSARALEITGMRADQMPRLVEGSQVSGTLRDDLRRDWGVSGSVVVAGGGGDNAAAACGIGCLREGSGFVSLGTSGVLLAARDAYAPAPETAVHTFCHAVPGRWYQMGVMLAATDCLNWLAGSVGQKPAHLAQALPDAISGPQNAIFLPYLSGERTPHNDAAIRGAFVGLDIAMGQQELTRSVMEGVAFGLRDNLDALKATGAQLDQLMAVGGGARSAFWLSTLATVLQMPLAIPADGEFGAAMGAVRLAICAAEGADPDAVMVMPETRTVIEPRVELADDYNARFAQFRALYPAIRNAL